MILTTTISLTSHRCEVEALAASVGPSLSSLTLTGCATDPVSLARLAHDARFEKLGALAFGRGCQVGVACGRGWLATVSLRFYCLAATDKLRLHALGWIVCPGLG